MGKFEEESAKMVKEVLGRRFELLEEFAKAYLSELSVDGKEVRIENLELVEQHNAGETRWHFRERV